MTTPRRSRQRPPPRAETRGRILAAAHEMLADPEEFTGFTIDGVARAAGYSRMTVYYQFGTSTQLLADLYEFLATRDLEPALGGAIASTEPTARLEGMVRAHCHFWADHGPTLRRVHALAVLDQELDATQHVRAERRRAQYRAVVVQLGGRALDATARERLVGTLVALSSFELFDLLVRSTHTVASATSLMTESCHQAVRSQLDASSG